MQRTPQQTPTTSLAPDRTSGVDRPVRAFAALARLLARQAARETLECSPSENREPADDEA